MSGMSPDGLVPPWAHATFSALWFTNVGHLHKATGQQPQLPKEHQSINGCALQRRRATKPAASVGLRLPRLLQARGPSGAPPAIRVAASSWGADTIAAVAGAVDAGAEGVEGAASLCLHHLR